MLRVQVLPRHAVRGVRVHGQPGLGGRGPRLRYFRRYHYHGEVPLVPAQHDHGLLRGLRCGGVLEGKATLMMPAQHLALLCLWDTILNSFPFSFVLLLP